MTTCTRCGGSLLYDRLEAEHVCLNCGARPRPANTLPYLGRNPERVGLQVRTIERTVRGL